MPRGIKNRLFLQFWILFLIAMLVVDVLMVFIFIERSVSQKIGHKMQALKDVCEATRTTTSAQGDYSNPAPAGLSPNDRLFFVSGPLNDRTRVEKNPSPLTRLVHKTLQDGKPAIKREGTRIGLFFFQHEFAVAACPVKDGDRTIAAGGIHIPLNDVYDDFNRIQIIALVFVVVNSLFMALIGNQQISRIYYRPLKRLANRAETFRDEDNLFFAVRKEDNEFSVLSSSLNKMLNRITEDKQVLRDTIGSLKEANNELKKAQNDIIRAEKMATVGRLTSGIAHEIGNPIGIVLGYLDLLKQPDLPEAERSDFIERSEQEIIRINNIIRQLLDMSRSSAGESKPVSVHQLLGDLICVFNYQPTASNITFQSVFTADDDRVRVDPDVLRQVFLNILLNAVDAVSAHLTDSGRIKITTESSAQSERQTLEITIADNGPGIDASDLPHVFDPFYTTKQPGKGTGLGLSVSFMIVERLGGHITVDQRPDSGAAFRVILPSFISGNDNIATG